MAAAAAAASYYATWRFKAADVNRENGLRAVDLVDEAEQVAARLERYDAEPDGGATAIYRLLQQARVRTQPLDDGELDDRFRAALYFNNSVLTWPSEPGRARYWLGLAITNVRLGLVPHLAAPRLLPRGTPSRERSFPTMSDLAAMQDDSRNGNVLIDELVDWRAAHPG